MKKLLSGALALMLGVTCVGALAGCDDDNATTNNDQEALQAAMSGIKAMYVDKYVDASTPNDYELVGQYPVNGTYCPINWTVNVTEGVSVKAMDETSKTVTVDVNEKTPTAVEYELTASITYNGLTETYTFRNLKVPAYVVNTYADYISATKGDKLRVTGTVTGFAKKGDGATANTIFMQDTDGGYYVYSLASGTLPEGLAIGKKLTVTGEYDLYNGLHELKSATVESIEDGTAVAPKDITDLVKAAENSKDKAIIALQSQLVTIKGATVYDVSATNNTYYGFKLGKVESYVRISTSDCPTGADNQEAIKTAHAANYGKTATVTGLVTVYGDAFYIIPVGADAFKDFAENTTPANEKVATEKGGVKLNDKITSSGDVALPTPTTYPDVKFTWESDNAAVVIADDNSKMTVTVPAKPIEVKITLTLKCGDVTDTKEFKVTVGSLGLAHAGTEADPFSAADAIKIAKSLDGSKKEYYSKDGEAQLVYVKGFVVDPGKYSSQYNNVSNVYIMDTYSAEANKDSEGALQVFRIVKDDTYFTAEGDIQKGDFVVVKGYIQNFNGTLEVTYNGKNNVSVVSLTKAADVKKGDTEGNPYTVAEVNEIFATLEKGTTYQVDGKDKEVYIKGYVTDAGKSGNYGLNNVYIADVAGTAKDDSVLVYSINWNDILQKGSALKVGDLVVIKGFLKDFNGTKEVADGKPGDSKIYPVVIVVESAEEEAE